MKRERDSWWDWRAKNVDEEQQRSDNLNGVQKTNSDLEKLVERCVVLDNLSPVSSLHTIRTALEQFGRVCGVKRLKDVEAGTFTGIAIAEMESRDQRDQVVKELRDYLLMIGQMPRPARAIPATPELMVDHPLRTSDKYSARLVSRRDPRWAEFHEIATKETLNLALHDELRQVRMEEEMKLERAQERQCQESIDKLKMLDFEKNSQVSQVMKSFYNIQR